MLDLTNKLILTFLGLSSISGWAGLAHSAVASDADHAIESPEGEKIRYPSEFFSQYNPVNARDMVDQVPGFRLNTGGDSRGFGGAAGIALIKRN